MLTLTSLNGQEKGREFQLTGEAPELLGRQAPTIQLADAQTSRKHAEVLLENNTWLIRDLDSTNGTWVNGQKITQITELEVGDRIVIGRHQFRVSAISDLPSPTPMPLPIPTEPLIGGDEDLGEMGVDLGESLSADILDDDALDLPEVPDSAIADEADDAPAQAEPATEKPEAPDDGVIDLDALLDADEDQGHSHDTATHAEPESKEDPPASSSNDADAGIIDLDELLDENPAEPEPDAEVEAQGEDETPVEDVAEDDSPVVLDDPPAEPVDTAPTAPDEEVDFDLDEMLADEIVDEPPAEPVEEVSQDEPADQEEVIPAEAPVEEPTEDTAAPLAADDKDEPDSIDDIDAMLEDLGVDEDGVAEDDVLASATPPAIETPAVEESQDDTDDEDESADPEEASSGDADSLIDIDILAAASPAVPLGPGPEEPETSDADSQPDAVDELEDRSESVSPGTDESGVFSDDSGILNAGDTGMDLDDAPGADLDDSLGGLHDTNQATGIDEVDSGPVVSEEEDPTDAAEQAEDEPLAQDLDEEARLQESERELLLTEQEQSKAVTGYKRSKLVTMTVLVLVSAAVGFGGWYAFDQFTNRADANARRSTKNPATSVKNPAETKIDNAAQPPTDPPKTGTGRIPIPDIQTPSPKVGRVPIPDIPDDTPPKNAPADDTTEDTTPKPTGGYIPIPDIVDTPADEPADTAPAEDTQAPDPFKDVESPVFDSTTNAAPAPAEPLIQKPSFEPSIPDVVSPEPTAQANPADDPPADTTPDESPVVVGSADEPAEPQADITAATNTPTETVAEVEPDVTEPTVADTAASDPNQTQLNILAGVIDAENKPGVGVNEQAAQAGARRIVYLVDASGSLVDSFPRVLNELSLSIVSLEEDQAFTAIFFGADGVTEVPPVGLKWADLQTKRNARDWIDPDSGNVTAWGRGDLMQALERATEYGADEIVILSDNLIGSRPSQKKIDTLIDDITQLTDGKVEKINVMQFFTRDPKQVLKTIAERFNGTYSLIPAISESSADHPGEDPIVFP